jgi:fructose-specific phosphotransferase system IIC component
MKNSILKAIIADKAQLIPLFVGGVVWGVLHILAYFGLSLTPAEQAGLAAFIGTLLAAILNGWALEIVSSGTKKIQQDLKEEHKWVEVDGVPGAQTRSAVKQSIDAAK